MEGLEVSVVAKSFAASEAATMRLDSEYFLRPYIDDATRVHAQSDRFSTLREKKIAVDGSAFYPAIEEYYDTGSLPFVRVGDVDGFVQSEGCLTIPSELCDRFPTLDRISAGDIVFTKGGAIDRVGLMFKEAAASRDIIHLATSALPRDERLFLFSYFRTDFFRRCLVRSSSQTAQPHLTLGLVRELPILLAGSDFKAAIGSLVVEAHTRQAQSRAAMEEAETLLLDALGLHGWSPPEPLTYTRSATAVAQAGRLDAEFAAPRVQALLALLSSSGQTLADVARGRREKFKPATEGVFDYIEISDLDGFGRCSSTSLDMIDAPSRATWHVRPGDVLTSTVRPIRRLSAIVAAAQDGDVCSSGFVVLVPTAISPECLLTFLRLPLVCELMHLFATASMYPALAEKDLMALPIPAIDRETDATVAIAVAKARAELARSEALLEAAKRAVEIAIEDSEAAALAFIAAQEAG